MTLEEIRKAKAELEIDLIARLTAFQRETSMDVKSIDITHFDFEEMAAGRKRVIAGLTVELEPI